MAYIPATGGTGSGSTLSGGSNWWSRMSPEVQSALIGGGMSLGGSLLAARGQGQQAEEDREAQERIAQLGIQDRNVDRALELALSRETQDQRGREGAAGMVGASPLAFQQDRNRMALMRAFLGGEGRIGVAPPGDIAPSMGQVSMPTFSPEALRFMEPGAMAAAEAPYWQAVSSLNPNLSVPDLGAAGYGRAGSNVSAALEKSRGAEQARQAAARSATDNSVAREKQALQMALSQQQPAVGTSSKKKDDKKGGSDWKKTAANIGLNVGLAYLGGGGWWA